MSAKSTTIHKQRNVPKRSRRENTGVFLCVDAACSSFYLIIPLKPGFRFFPLFSGYTVAKTMQVLRQIGRRFLDLLVASPSFPSTIT